MEHEERQEENQTVWLDTPLPAATVGALRALYAPPRDPEYWTALHAGIVARLAAPQWWQILDEWRHAGLVAAAAIFAVVGALVAHTRATELRTAYEAVTASPTPAGTLALPATALSADEGPDVREVTFRDVLSQ